jgi:ferritin
MIGKKMQEALNAQIKEEFFSASLYLAISAWCNERNYLGAAHFFKVQAKEEVSHALKIFDYLFEVEGRSVVPGLDRPPVEFSGMEDIFKKALEHEKFITDRIHKLVKLAREENDMASENFLQWYVKEQVEEEAQVVTILAQLKMVGTDSRGIFLLDRELGKRE